MRGAGVAVRSRSVNPLVTGGTDHSLGYKVSQLREKRYAGVPCTSQAVGQARPVLNAAHWQCWHACWQARLLAARLLLGCCWQCVSRGSWRGIPAWAPPLLNE